jgi:hypothetical protein
MRFGLPRRAAPRAHTACLRGYWQWGMPHCHNMPRFAFLNAAICDTPRYAFLRDVSRHVSTSGAYHDIVARVTTLWRVSRHAPTRPP